MRTSVDELHLGELDMSPRPGQDQRLYVDLDICAMERCRKCVVVCSYFYHPGNVGMLSVAELATYALVCRKCENPHCVAACPAQALEQQQDKGRHLVRHTARCVGCRSCSHACPYGTIYPEYVPVITRICDYCWDRRGKAGEPACIGTCPYGALRLVPGDAGGEGTFLVGDHLVVHSTHWTREKA